jgi:hypothetical protein
MQTPMKQSLFWTPRILALLFAAFVSMFALDVFGEGYGFWKTILALVMHLIPTGIILLALAIGWRWQWAGGVLFIGLGVLYLVTGGVRFHWPVYAMISGPLFVIGGLFLLNWRYRAELRST